MLINKFHGDTMFITPAWAQTGADTGSALGALLPFILIFAVIYFLMIRPQQKRQKEHQAKISAAKKGDQIITNGGLYGVVKKTDDQKPEMQVEIAPDVLVKINKFMIADVISKDKKANVDKTTDANKPKGLLATIFGGTQSNNQQDNRKKDDTSNKDT